MQHCECTKCYSVVHFEIVTFMLYKFHLLYKKDKIKNKKTQCFSLFCVFITEYLSLGNLKAIEVYLAHGFGGWEVQEHDTAYYMGLPPPPSHGGRAREKNR